MNAAQADVSYSDTARQNYGCCSRTHRHACTRSAAPFHYRRCTIFYLESSRPRTAQSSPPATSALASRPRHSPLPASTTPWRKFGFIMSARLSRPVFSRFLRDSPSSASMPESVLPTNGRSWQLRPWPSWNRSCATVRRFLKPVEQGNWWLTGPFRAWRALPRDFHAEFQRRLLAVWANQPTAGCIGSGGPVFRFLARLGGQVNAAHVCSVPLRGHSYDSCRTIEDPRVLEEWIAQLPAALKKTLRSFGIGKLALKFWHNTGGPEFEIHCATAVLGRSGERNMWAGRKWKQQPTSCPLCPSLPEARVNSIC